MRIRLNVEQYFVAQIDSKSNGFTIIESSLPDLDAKVESIIQKDCSLEVLFETFGLVTELLEEFYKNMDTIDQLCYVIEPQIIDLKTNWRIIRFSERVLLKVEVTDLFNVSSGLNVKFYGKDQEVHELMEIYETNVVNWDDSIDIYKNLLRIFDIMYLPMKPDSYDEDNMPPCSICFSFRCESSNQIPLIQCDNSKCDSIFHINCMERWLEAHRDTKEIMCTSIGVCPFCKEKLSASFTELRKSLVKHKE